MNFITVIITEIIKHTNQNIHIKSQCVKKKCDLANCDKNVICFYKHQFEKQINAHINMQENMRVDYMHFSI